MTSTENASASVARTKATTKVRLGVVVKAKMTKTVVVEVVRRVRHPKYVKFVSERARYFAHDDDASCAVGDRVAIEEVRPMSKLKRWRVTRVIERAAGA